jgi:predicted aconitase
MAGTEVAVLVGLDARAGEDRLKAIGAAAASSGAVAMFHALGVTPEAATIEVATGGVETRQAIIGMEALRQARAGLSRGSGPLGAVSVGTPHFSAAEIAGLSALVAGRSTRVPFYVNTGRDVIADPALAGPLADLAAFGATVVTDTCTYITPIMGDVRGVVMTNSGKWAFYAPANLGVEVVFAGLETCVESAVSGQVKEGEQW